MIRKLVLWAMAVTVVVIGILVGMALTPTLSLWFWPIAMIGALGLGLIVAGGLSPFVVFSLAVFLVLVVIGIFIGIALPLLIPGCMVLMFWWMAAVLFRRKTA